MSVRLIDCDRSRAQEILAILNEAIEHSTALYDYRPRTMATMESWFDAKEKGQYPVIGAVDDQNRLLGFASYGPFRSWPAYKYSVEHSVYVDKDWRGRGIGKLLLEAIIARARAHPALSCPGAPGNRLGRETAPAGPGMVLPFALKRFCAVVSAKELRWRTRNRIAGGFRRSCC